MGRCISSVELNKTLSLSECNDGWWLYDRTRGMNLSMRAKTAQDAFVETITYYQRRLTEVQAQYNDLRTKVDRFVESVHECPNDEEG